MESTPASPTHYAGAEGGRCWEMKQNWKSFPSSAPDLCSTTQNPFLVHGVVSTLILPSLKAQKSLPSIEVQGETSAGSVGEQRPRFSPRTHTGIICHIGSSKALLRRQTIQIFWSEKFSREFTHELYNWGNCLRKANFVLLKNCNSFSFFLEVAKCSWVCMNLFLALCFLLTCLTTGLVKICSIFHATKKKRQFLLKFMCW